MKEIDSFTEKCIAKFGIKGEFLYNNKLCDLMIEFNNKQQGNNETEEEKDPAHSMSVIHREVDDKIKLLSGTIFDYNTCSFERNCEVKNLGDIVIIGDWRKRFDKQPTEFSQHNNYTDKRVVGLTIEDGSIITAYTLDEKDPDISLVKRWNPARCTNTVL